MRLTCLLILTCLISPIVLLGQQKITNEAIWRDRLFTTQSVPGFNFLNDGRHYTKLEDNVIQKYDITTGQWVEDLFTSEVVKGQLGFSGNIDRFSFNHDETKLLLESDTERIYRRSYRASYHIYDMATGEFHALFEEGKVQNATFSPDSRYVAYIYDNNIFYYDLENQITLPITFDGRRNAIINGITDWVYEEEFAFVKAFWWSPDSRRILFLRFDETDVPEYTMTYHEDKVYPRYETFKYPKVGQKNAEISALLYDISTEEVVPIDLGSLDDQYIPRVKWTQNPSVACVYKMNRHQNRLDLILVDAESLETKILLTETNPYYIDIDDDLTFLEDGQHFIWTSEMNGYNHIYKYNMNGTLVLPLTSGPYDVTNFYGVDEKNGAVFYQAAARSPLEREVYRVTMDAKGRMAIAAEPGVNSARFSNTFEYFTWQHSTINTPPTYTVCGRKGRKIRTIEDNEALREAQKDHGVQDISFFQFDTEGGITLNGWMLKPPDFDPTRQYPVFMYQYSGPGSQQVTNAWKGSNYWWFQMLANDGYVIACVDGRGTGARGQEFKKMTYLQLGNYETTDQIQAAKYLGSLPYLDASRIGIFGWSYGGYMSSLCILKGNDVFSTAIAVAPVTNWKWYDTIYTERYMRTEEENPHGYKDNSPVYFADRLRGSYLLVHGSTDDNVHFQNSMEMAKALISANKQFDQYIYPNRRHGITGDNARLHLYTKMTQFLEENLKNKALVVESRP